VSDMPFQDFLDLAGVAVDDGHIVTAKALRVVEIIRDYDHHLEVEWIPPEHRLPGDDAIRIVDTTKRGLARMVMSFKDEGEFTAQDGRAVLERLFLADHERGNPMRRMEAHNDAARVLALKREREQYEEGLDLMRHALAGPHTYTARSPITGEKKVYR
jgi:hypothetical protein